MKAPPELSIDSNGVLQGTFAAPNSSFVTVTVKDAAQPTPRSASHQYDFNALLPITITSINPSTAAAGIGQLVALDVQGVPSLNGLHAYFKDSVNTIGEGFIFQSPSSTSRLFVRLPTQPSLVNGPLLVYLKNDSVTGPAASMTLAAIPGTPTIRFVLPTQPVIEGCPLVGSTPITEIASGIPIGVSAFGVDTVSAVLRFTQNNQFVDVFSQCDNNGDVIGVAAIFTVPQFNDGDIVIQIRTSVNQINSEWSAPVHLTVKNPS